MDIKSSIKQRREERIRDLLLREEPTSSPQPVQEQPLWNKGRIAGAACAGARSREGLEKEHAKGGGPSYHKSRFVSGFMWRVFFSVIMFGLIWGLFKYPQPWSMKIQDYVMQSLNREMDFQAVEAWYESHFGEALGCLSRFSSKTRHRRSKSMLPSRCIRRWKAISSNRSP